VDPVVALRRRPRRICIAVCLAFSVTGGCTTTDENTRPLPGSSPSTITETSTSPDSTVYAVDKAKREALTAYRAMWQDFIAAGTTSDWQSSRLAQHATGTALQNLSRGLYADHQNGVVTRGEPILQPAVSSVEPATDPKKVVITDCGDSTNFLKYDKETGRPADNEQGGRQLINAIVELQSDGSWKVSDYGVHEVGSCA
jgi:hypothetical protein